MAYIHPAEFHNGFVCGAKVMDHSRYNCVTSCMRNKIEILNYCYISFCTLSFHLLSVNPKISGGCLNDRDIFLEKFHNLQLQFCDYLEFCVSSN